MIKVFELNKNLTKKNLDEISRAWKDKNNKVFYIKNRNLNKNIRNFYEKFGKRIGKLKYLAEDIKLGDRNNQRANKIWMEVKFDPSIKNAYRHSSSSQPLHTDGSYVPEYPNSTLMCCKSK